MAPTAAKKPSKAPRRRTQAERSAATRGVLLDATIESLVEVGYANTTTTRIAELAGVSRGAQMHHFPSKADLVAHAVEHLAEKRAEEIRKEADRLPGGSGGRTAAALDLLWSSHRGPLFQASLELWTAARTDRELREKLVPVERRLVLNIYDLCRDLFGERVASNEKFEPLLAMSLSMMQGLALLQSVELEPRQLERAWGFYRDQLVELFEGSGKSGSVRAVKSSAA